MRWLSAEGRTALGVTEEGTEQFFKHSGVGFFQEDQSISAPPDTGKQAGKVSGFGGTDRPRSHAQTLALGL